MKRITKFLMVTMVLLSLLLAGCGGRNNAIGSVDMSKVAEQTDLFKNQQEQMQAKLTQAQKELEDASKNSTPEEMEKLQNAKGLELRAYKERMENELKHTVEAALADVAKDKKLGAVLIKEAVAQGGIDVTEDVINKLKTQSVKK